MAPRLGPLSFEDVTKVYREEKKSSGLTAIRHDFYPAVRVLMDQLKRDYENEATSDSYGAKARQLSQQIAKMREKVLQIFDMRAEKIMNMAILGAAGGKVDHSRLTEEEKRVLEGSLVQVREMRNGLLDMPRPSNLEFARMSSMPVPAPTEEESGVKLEEMVPVEGPEAPAIEAVPRPEEPRPTLPIAAPPVPRDQVPVEVTSSLTEVQRPGKDTILLRILEDIPPFAGPSGTFKLGKEDIVTLPASIGKGLVKRGKAVEITVGS